MRTVWRRLAALCLAAILVASCSTQADDSPAPGISSSQPPVDYQALQAAIETKIMSGSVGWQTIEAVLVSVPSARSAPSTP
jgi:hypothetical protein